MNDGQKGLRVLLMDSFVLLQKCFVKLCLLTLLAIFVFVTSFFIWVIMNLIISAGLTKVWGVTDKNTAMALFTIILSLGVVFIVTVTFLLYAVGSIKLIQAAENKENLKIVMACKNAYAIGGSYLLVSLWVVLKVLLWSLLLIVPGIIFGIFYSFSNLAVILDDKRGKQALIYSASVIKPYVWKYIGNSLAVVLITIGIYLACAYLLNLIFGVPEKGHLKLLPVVGQILKTLINIVVGLYGTVFSYLLYKELKKRVALASVSGAGATTQAI